MACKAIGDLFLFAFPKGDLTRVLMLAGLRSRDAGESVRGPAAEMRLFWLDIKQKKHNVREEEDNASPVPR